MDFTIIGARLLSIDSWVPELDQQKKGDNHMKEKGVIRHLDTLGRVVIPKEFRNHFNIENGDSVEIFNTNYGILIRKYRPQEDVLDLLVEVEDKLKKGMDDDKATAIKQHLSDMRVLLEEQ